MRPMTDFNLVKFILYCRKRIKIYIDNTKMIVYNVCARYKPNFTVLAQPLVLISFELCRENSRISKTYTHIIASTTTLRWKGL